MRHAKLIGCHACTAEPEEQGSLVHRKFNLKAQMKQNTEEIGSLLEVCCRPPASTEA